MSPRQLLTNNYIVSEQDESSAVPCDFELIIGRAVEGVVPPTQISRRHGLAVELVL
jgi:hypothetical protein